MEEVSVSLIPEPLLLIVIIYVETSMKSAYLFLPSLIVCLLCSCGHDVVPYFSEIKYIQEFPVSIENCKLDSVAIDCSGAYDIDLSDSCIVLCCPDENGFIKCFSVDDFSFLGSFLKRGRGPGEIVSPHPTFELCSDVICVETGRSMYVCDLKKSILTGMPDIIGNIEHFYSAIPMCDSSLIVTDIYEECGMEGIRRRKITIPSSFENISSTREIDGFVQPKNPDGGGNIPSSPIFTRVVSYSPGQHKVVEVAARMNFINVYPTDTSEGGFSICYGTSIQPEASLWKSISPDESTVFFTGVRAYDDFFIVSYLGEVDIAYLSGKCKKTDFLFFSWEGVPLLKLTVDCFVTSFGYDCSTQTLYVLDRNDGYIRKCCIASSYKQL